MDRGETAAGGIRDRMGKLAQEVERKKHLTTLRNDTLRKVEYLKSKAVIDVHDAYALVKEFFQSFLDQKREFTVSELRTELRTIYLSSTTRQTLDEVLDRLHAVEYATVHYTRQDLIMLLERFADVVKQLIRTHATQKGVLSRLRDLLFKQEAEPAMIIAELPAIEGDDPEGVRVRTLIEKCYIALDAHNLHRAKAAYQALLTEYERLDEGRRERFYPLVHQAYQDIGNRARMA